MLKTFSFVSVLALLASNAFAADCRDEANYAEVSKTELKTLVEQKAVFVVDVNSSDSFAKNHVPGAIHFGANEKDFAKMLPAKKDALIVAYCGGPQCTAWKKAATRACENGYTKIKHFKGGIKGWVDQKS